MIITANRKELTSRFIADCRMTALTHAHWSHLIDF